MSSEELPSVLSNRVFKVRDWNRLEAYRLDTKIRALESEKKNTYARISLEQREVRRDLIKLQEAASQRKKSLSLAERRLGFALKRSSSDLALTIERSQQAFIADSSVSKPRARSDSAPVSLPPVADRAGVSTPPSWTEQNFGARRRAIVEAQTSWFPPKQRSSSFSRNLSPLCGNADKPPELKRKSAPGVSSQSSESNDCAAGEESVQNARATPRARVGAPQKRLLRSRSYSTNSLPLPSPDTAGRQRSSEPLASLSETFDIHAAATSPRRGRVAEGARDLTPQNPPRTRQRSQTLPGLGSSGTQSIEKLEALDNACYVDDSVFEWSYTTAFIV